MTPPRILDAPQTSTKYKPNAAKKAGEAARIEHLGKLNDAHSKALTAGDKAGLKELAKEYRLIGCPNMASQIMYESDNL